MYISFTLVMLYAATYISAAPIDVYPRKGSTPSMPALADSPQPHTAASSNDHNSVSPQQSLTSEALAKHLEPRSKISAPKSAGNASPIRLVKTGRFSGGKGVILPKMKIPKPKRPKVKIPKVKIPKRKGPATKLPKIKNPRPKTPKRVKIPKVKVPKVKVPKVKGPKKGKQPDKTPPTITYPLEWGTEVARKSLQDQL